MSEHHNEIGRELTDHELMLVQGGGLWSRVKKAGSWVSDKVESAWNYVNKVGRNPAVGAIIDVFKAVINYDPGKTEQRPVEVIR